MHKTHLIFKLHFKCKNVRQIYIVKYGNFSSIVIFYVIFFYIVILLINVLLRLYLENEKELFASIEWKGKKDY